MILLDIYFSGEVEYQFARVGVDSFFVETWTSANRAHWAKIINQVSLIVWAGKSHTYIIINMFYVQFNKWTLISLLYFIGSSWEAFE